MYCGLLTERYVKLEESKVINKQGDQFLEQQTIEITVKTSLSM